MSVGESIRRVDAYEKVTGRARFTDDFFDHNPLIAKVLHSTIANGRVVRMDISEAMKVPGVVKIVTCFDVPDIEYPTAGHPWSTDPLHQDVADRKLLNTRVRLYGDDIAAVVAENEIAAIRALRMIEVEYEEYEPILDVFRGMEPDATRLHDNYPGNILAHSKYDIGGFDNAVKAEDGLIEVEGWYETPTVQHCPLENPVSMAYMEKGRIVIITSTQIPHIVRRIVGQALGIPCGDVRVIKPYVGGGFGNKQDALYEPLNAYLTAQVGGRCVLLNISREETFTSTRVRHAIKYHIKSYVRPDGTFYARSMEAYSNQGAYASHGHAVAANGGSAFRMMYKFEKAVKCDIYSVFTNMPTAGAMRGYGMPQETFAMESHVDDIARVLNMDPLEFRMKNRMEKGYKDESLCLENNYDTLLDVTQKGKEAIDWASKRKQYAAQTGNVRRGIGMSLSWYYSGVWPLALETTTVRMTMNQDGSIQMQVPETEIGQGADTAFSQMAASALSIPFHKVHLVSTQDTDIVGYGSGAYASRQTYVVGNAIRCCADKLKERIFKAAEFQTKVPKDKLDVKDSVVINTITGDPVISLKDLSTASIYSMERSEHITAEVTRQTKSNALSMGCCFAEVEVDIPLGKVTVLNIINVHDCGMLINPQLAEAQVHGGMAMGIGYGISETLQFDQKTGKPLNNNLLDYKLPTAMDISELTAAFVENPEPTSAFGTKGLGEPPAIPPAAAIRNAVLNATGVAVNKAPLNPHILFEKFKEAGLIISEGR